MADLKTLKPSLIDVSGVVYTVQQPIFHNSHFTTIILPYEFYLELILPCQNENPRYFTIIMLLLLQTQQ